MSQTKQGYLPTLDGWRAVAILAVLLDHTVAYASGESSTVFRLTRVGPNGVSLFFAISGFLICSRLLEEQRIFGHISLSGFYTRRACRILPAAVTYLLVVGLLGLGGIILIDSKEWLASLFFFRNYLPPHSIQHGWGGYTIHYWSLAVEEHFYLIWPTLLVLSGKRRARIFAIALTAVVSMWRYWELHHQWVASLLPGLQFPSRTDVRLDGLFLGCLVALLLDDPVWYARARRYFTFVPWLACIIAYALFTVLARQHLYTVWEAMLLPVIVAGTVIRPEARISKLLESRALRWVGRLSYSLYLWQQLFAVPGARIPLAYFQRFPFNLVASILFAFLSYEFVERPMVRLGHRLAPPPTPGRVDLNEPTPPDVHAQLSDPV